LAKIYIFDSTRSGTYSFGAQKVAGSFSSHRAFKGSGIQVPLAPIAKGQAPPAPLFFLIIPPFKKNAPSSCKQKSGLAVTRKIVYIGY
jgi:hypothetical protein